MSPLRIAIAGCTGRMGRALVRLATADPALRLVAAATMAPDRLIGQDAATLAGASEPLGVTIGEQIGAACDVLVEFTAPAGCCAWAQWCAQNGAALVSGTTGLGDAERAALRAAAERVPVLWAANMSVGVNLLLGIAGDVARGLGDGWDIEITETHHRHKVDAPSGTARALLQAICESLGRDADQAAVYGRHGNAGPRKPGEIGVHVLRMGEVVGEHEVFFGSAGESIMLQHRAASRDTFAAGALRAAKWLAGRAPGLYTMSDVLFA